MAEERCITLLLQCVYIQYHQSRLQPINQATEECSCTLHLCHVASEGSCALCLCYCQVYR